jgi:hypothetical protein
VAVVKPDVSAKIFVNNVDRVGYWDASYRGPILNYDTSLYIGGSSNIGKDSFYGIMDEVCIWNRALSDTEVSDLYNLGIGKTYPFN